MIPRELYEVVAKVLAFIIGIDKRQDHMNDENPGAREL